MHSLNADTEPAASQLLLRDIIPENRLRVFDVRRIIHIVCDKDGGVIEIRRDFGLGMVCCLGRIGGYSPTNPHTHTLA